MVTIMKKHRANGSGDTGSGEPQGRLVVKRPNLVESTFHIFGTSPYLQNKFSGTKLQKMLKNQQVSQGTSKKSKTPRDIDAEFEGAIHRLPDGGYGIPAPGIRNALIDACRVAGLVMTKAKLSIFVKEDGFDPDDGMPLVRLIAGDPEVSMLPVRLPKGEASVAIRPMWKQWEADVTLRWDSDQFDQENVANLLERAGQQVGTGEGRHNSKKSNGLGYGCFSLMQEK